MGSLKFGSSRLNYFVRTSQQRSDYFSPYGEMDATPKTQNSTFFSQKTSLLTSLLSEETVEAKKIKFMRY